MKLEQSVKRLGRNSLTYSLAALLSRGIAFLLFPVYATYLSPAEYGILAITSLVNSVLIMLLPLGLLNVVHRFHFTFENVEERKSFYGTIWSFLIFVSGVVTFSLWHFGQPIFEFLFTQTPFSPYIQIALLLAFFNTAFLTLPIRLFQIEEKAFSAAGLTTLQFIITAIFVIYFLIFPQLGVIGALYGQLIGISVASLVAFIVLLRQTTFNLYWSRLHDALRYSVPLIPHFISSWILNISDRAILERYLPLSDVGIYSVGYQFGSLFQMIVTGFNNALIPMHSRAIKDPAEKSQIPRMVTYFLSALAFIGLTLALLGDEALFILTANAYENASTVIPWVVGAYMAMGFYYVGMDSLIIISGKTKQVPVISFIAAGINIVINIYFVPRFGFIVAAISTTVSYIFQAAIILIVANRFQSIPYEWGRIIKAVVTALILFFIGQIIASPINNLFLSIFVKGIVLVVFPAILFMIGFFEKNERQFVGRYLRSNGFTSIANLLNL